jgi:hypothetical protein
VPQAHQRSSLFREVNERIRELSETWDDAQPVGFICECDDAACTAPVALTLAAYDAIRCAPQRLVVLTGHEPRRGEVVTRNDGYVVVAESLAPQAA